LNASNVATYIFITPTYTTIIKGTQHEQKNGCQFLTLLCGCNHVIKGIKGLAKSSLHYTMFSLKNNHILYLDETNIYIWTWCSFTHKIPILQIQNHFIVLGKSLLENTSLGDIITTNHKLNISQLVQNLFIFNSYVSHIDIMH
jgi:hypothetical protein